MQDAGTATQEIRSIVQELQKFEFPHHRNEPDRRFPRAGLSPRKDRTMFDLLLQYWHTECNDPRDKIFSMIGIAARPSPPDSLLKVDYTKSLEEIFFLVLSSCRSTYHESWGPSFATFGAVVGRSLGLNPNHINRYLTDINMLTVPPSTEIEGVPISASYPVYIENLGPITDACFINYPAQFASSSDPLYFFQNTPLLFPKYPFPPHGYERNKIFRLH